MTVRVRLLKDPAGPGMLVGRNYRRPRVTRWRVMLAGLSGAVVAVALLWRALIN